MDLPADPITLLSVGIAGLMIVACVGGCLYYTIWVKCLEPRWREIKVKYLVPCWISTRRGCIRPCRAGTEGCLSTISMHLNRLCEWEEDWKPMPTGNMV